MKKTIRLLCAATLLVTFASGCAVDQFTKNTGEAGEVVFNLSTGAGRSAADRAAAPLAFDDVRAVVVSIETAEGGMVYDMARLEVVNMNGVFISQSLSLPVGDYR
ncbi:MAG TPA: hypothetical protein ENN69_00025, partial [Spirochaetia bacterium]|nr:hypothetical protein [Spirochaetia bacterium]